MCKTNNNCNIDRIAQELGVPRKNLRTFEFRKLVKLNSSESTVFKLNTTEYKLDTEIDTLFAACGVKMEILKLETGLDTSSTPTAYNGQFSALRMPYVDPAYFDGATEVAALTAFFNSEGEFKLGGTSDKGKIYVRDMVRQPEVSYYPAANSGTGSEIFPLFDHHGGLNGCMPLKQMMVFDPNADYTITLPHANGLAGAVGIEGTDNTVVPGTENYALLTFCGCCVASGPLCGIPGR